METTGGDAYFINEKNEIHNRSIHNMEGAGIIGSNHHVNKWCYSEETPAEVYGYIIHSVLDNTLPRFAWYGKKHSIH